MSSQISTLKALNSAPLSAKNGELNGKNGVSETNGSGNGTVKVGENGYR